ncbi:hypothetical protein DFJ63DRAFT_313694 [Scheffersomyces coipomensis]|uniref:uncharacterized protein n=1 Tax=Scheffersomyces coipomensis TaxID=1788519 RepID=UPI00315C7756
MRSNTPSKGNHPLVSKDPEAVTPKLQNMAAYNSLNTIDNRLDSFAIISGIKRRIREITSNISIIQRNIEGKQEIYISTRCNNCYHSEGETGFWASMMVLSILANLFFLFIFKNMRDERIAAIIPN